jgi:hypothetical protein
MAVRFAPPGDFLDPYPLGTTLTGVDAGLSQLTLNSVLLDANTQVAAVTDQNGEPVNQPPPAGYQYALASLSVTNSLSYPISLADYFQGDVLDPAGAYLVEDAHGPDPGFEPFNDGHWSQLDPLCQAPALDLNSSNPVPPGQTTGNLCFTISSQDASTTMFVLLVGGHEVWKPQWFALN